MHIHSGLHVSFIMEFDSLSLVLFFLHVFIWGEGCVVCYSLWVKVREQLGELALFLQQVNPRDGAQVVRFGGSTFTL